MKSKHDSLQKTELSLCFFFFFGVCVCVCVGGGGFFLLLKQKTDDLVRISIWW